MEKGDVAKYLPTSTVGRVEDVMERDGRVWVKLDRTGLYYAAETLTPADPKEYRATSFKERSAKKKDYRSGETVEDLNEMERNVDIDDLMPSGGGRALPAPDPETPCPLSGAGFFPSHPAFAGRPRVASSIPTARIPPADARRRLPSDVGCRTWRGRKRALRGGDGSFQGLASGKPLCPYIYLDQDTVGMAYYQESSPAYCKNCGHRLGMESNFCSSCGCSLREEGGGYGRPLYVLTDKNVGIAVLLSLLIVGAGHMYVGKVAAGAVWFIGLSIITLACCFLAADIYFFPILLLPFFMYVCAAYDAYKLAERYNESIRTKGRKPW